MPAKKDPRLARAGVSGYNKPKRTPSHKTKSHVVVAKSGGQVKTIRFGQQGKTGDRTNTARSRSFKARHAKNIAKGPMSAAYWANKVKWQSMEERIARMEKTLDKHSSQISKLFSRVDDTNACIQINHIQKQV